VCAARAVEEMNVRCWRAVLRDETGSVDVVMLLRRADVLAGEEMCRMKVRNSEGDGVVMLD
jgi:hypothetical protein